MTTTEPDSSTPTRASWSKFWWALAWGVSVVVAFILGSYSATAPPTAPAATTAAPDATTAAPDATTAPAANDLPQPQTDPKVVELLQSLPHRQKDDPTAIGKVDAKVVMVMWSDYRCPFCSLFTRKTLPHLRKYVDDGTLRIEFRDLPLFGEQSEAAAYAGRAAAAQGRFWEFHHVVATHAPNSGHPDLPNSLLEQYAKEAGVSDLAKFRADFANAATHQAVADDASQARGLGINSTPFFVINTTVIPGAQPLEIFTGVIEREAHR